ncbi:ubiquinol-cytochrome c reductase iron-sulfur subunit [Halorientalis salina]|uniref:ubiquinol-cytochrome c reductase iron-sulfur subunit n=1 Tax=Halorientalis salina TaxID=2932266 RepID=UPI0010AC1D1E|nr:ubiquinol-cytochrome c reductase iron-sulfur subunit [Halorientalis salina]
MPLDEDKYPKETGRRRFVKGVVGSATLASVGVGGAAALDTVTSPTGVGGGITQFVGIENTDGPAPRGMPIIPIQIENGELKGMWPSVQEETQGGQTVKVAKEQFGGMEYSNAWFQYCGVQNYEGLAPEADQDNFFRSIGSPNFEWQAEAKEGGEKLLVSDFDDYEEWGNGIGADGVGKPAEARWRSEGDVQTLTVQIIRSTKVEEIANGNVELDDPNAQEFFQAATDQGFIAWLNKCTHFCCVPGFKTQTGSAKFGAENDVYCQCHQSIYDPFNPVSSQFVALPRPESDGGSEEGGE